MQYDSEATIVSELFKFAETGQLYRGAKPVMWSPVEKTALAEAEIEYEDIVSTQIDVAFEIVESPIPELIGAHAVIWTTTPWTIPVNQAIAYGPEVEYFLVEVTGGSGPASAPVGKRFLIADELIAEFERRTSWTILRRSPVDAGRSPTGPSDFIAKPALIHGDKVVPSPSLKGSELAGTMARHPMHKLGGFFARPRPFLPGDFVTTDQGTGLVHMAPDHGEDDFELCRAYGIDPVFAVDAGGFYRSDWLWLGGQGSVINAKFNAPDGPINSHLRETGGLLAASADFRHSYPHSWRSKAKVIYRCTPQWFIAMDAPLGQFSPETRAEQRWDNEGGSVPQPLPLAGGEEPRSGEGAGLPLARTSPPPAPPASGRGEASQTLRQLALQAIADTRWVPAKGENRIRSMVEGRPDWVISRQRAWGVPIALFVDRNTGELLIDPDVNRRIVTAIRENGVDAWSAENAAQFLGPDRNPDDYEMVGDILDVWFDSGCTHVFVLESGRWPDERWPADLYLEGSDQHRGWFQSSLLESCGTRGRAPYNAVLTHGFTMDAKGMKMSKSLGNTVNPLDLMRDYGADILRLWALSVDFTEDHRIGKEILGGVADQYRKLRNTFRYLLGALNGFDGEQGIAPADMPELERYMLGLLSDLDERLHNAIQAFDFNDYVRALTEFCNEDLSAFYFDIRKDVLYCDVNALTGEQSKRRAAYRSVLDVLFMALVRYAAPVLVFTSEEVWGTRFSDGGSVHLLEWPNVHLAPELRVDAERWKRLRELRATVTEAIEPLRRDKVIGSSLEAEVTLPELPAPADFLAELFIVSAVHPGDTLNIAETDNHKCGRCWRYLPEVEEDGGLCDRCEDVVNG
jgi:isoleucyl-tRNA synthetase